MTELEEQVARGQAALGRLIRQFIAVNDYKHVQLMSMAYAVTGVRWIHSSQISTLKQGATRNLTGFPLFSIALINRKIWEINEGIARAPRGTRMEDWENKKPMTREDGAALDIGDLWRIYFGEMKAPLFSECEIEGELSPETVKDICLHLHQCLARYASDNKEDALLVAENATKFIEDYDIVKAKKIKGVLLGVIDLSPEELSELIEEVADTLSRILLINIKPSQVLANDFSFAGE
jgi:hypothetical protein